MMHKGPLSMFEANEKGHMTIGGCDCVDLIKEFGSPLYVMDEAHIRQNCRFYVDAIRNNYDGHGMPLYASKAFSSLAMCKIADQEGMGLDVVSAGELYTAIQAGFPADRIYFHGNNKSIEELDFALDNDIHCFVVDNYHELRELNRLAGEKGKTADISFRIKPGIEAHTHEYIKTGQIDSKFGVALENGEAHEIVKTAVDMPNVNVIGVHCHIGSQIMDVVPFADAAEVMLGFIEDVKNKYGVEIAELNLGGGFGISYTESDPTPEYDRFISTIADRVKSICAEKNLKQPFILIEPGRSIVGNPGVTLYTVGFIKEIKDVRTYVSVDGGMSDNPRYALYEAEYEAALANKYTLPRDTKVTLAGKSCESGDLIGKDMLIQKPEEGDIIAVFGTGAYNYSMASNYNRLCKPPVILVKDGKARVIVKREDFKDLVRNDVVPDDLA